MTNQELDNLLKHVTPPERDQAYWEEFPGRVLVRFGSGGRVQEHAPRDRRAGLGLRMLGLAGAGAVLVISLWFVLRGTGPADQAQLRSLSQCYRELASLFPNQVAALVLDQGELRLLLNEEANVPDSPPLYVRICERGRCVTTVTFSGQQISFVGRQFEVLADSGGNVILMDQQGVWTPTRASRKEALRLEAGLLPEQL